MVNGVDNLMIQNGFQMIGSYDYNLSIQLWWHPDHCIQVIIGRFDDQILVKGFKSYYLRSMSQESQTWARDIPGLHDYLLSHFPECHISLAHFRDVNKTIVNEHLKSMDSNDVPVARLPSLGTLRSIQQQKDDCVTQRQRLGILGSMLDSQSDSLGAYIRQKTRTLKQQATVLKEDLCKKKKQYEVLEKLQREYLTKGSALCLSFTIVSNMHFSSVSTPEINDIITEVTKELNDAHRYQVMQKLNGSRLNIHVEPAGEPLSSWLETFMVGAFSPNELDELSETFQQLYQIATKHTMVVPDQDIQVDGSTKQTAKRIGAWAISDLLQRLDHTENISEGLGTVEKERFPVCLGRMAGDKDQLGGQVIIPIADLGHIYLSGRTGSGKSFAARIIIEETIQHDYMGVLILDPRNQSFGLKVAQDNQQLLNKYKQFGLGQTDPCGFDINYFAPGIGIHLPSNIEKLATGHNVVSFKDLDDQQRCELFGTILNQVFNNLSQNESPKPRLLVVIEEAHRFTRQRLKRDKPTDEAARAAENALDLIMREGRKYGIQVLILSQTLGDFTHSARTIRQNTTTRILMSNSDREIEYAAEFMDNPRQISILPCGTGLIHHPGWPLMRVAFRPPKSKVWEFAADQVRRIQTPSDPPTTEPDSDVQAFLNVVIKAYQAGEEPLNTTEVGLRADLTSKRKIQDCLSVLENSGIISTRQLPQRGRPRVIILNPDSISSEAGLNTGQNQENTIVSTNAGPFKAL
ncbi:MAG: DUF87 domain-containing protein [Candidatus Babeliaceae bacterium]|nr:DUF87 domain-containing protein [Candidatus Babeliaceae bacterium]